MKNIFLVQKANYHITEIVEEKVPLASGADCPYYEAALATLIVAICILLLGGYIAWCYKYRKRVLELKGECKGIAGWNCWKLKNKICELEMQRTEDMMAEMVKK